MNTFLKCKHWQLFGLLVCSYFAFQIAGTTTVVLSQGEIKQLTEHHYFIFKTSKVISSQETANDVSTVGSSQRNKVVTVTRYSPMVILFIAILFGWFYAVGVNLNKKLSNVVKMNLIKFKWIFFILITYMLLFYVFVYFVFFKSVSNGIEPNFGIFAAIIPLYLFPIFCFLYCICFIAKSLKAVELQRPVALSDYVWEFLLFLFFPIGVWLIQPRINKIFSEKT